MLAAFRGAGRCSAIRPIAARALSVPTDEAIAKAADMKPIVGLVEEKLGIDPDVLQPYGRYKAKLPHSYINDVIADESRPDGKLILVTALTPTKAGEGKTTTSVGLADGLCQLGESAMVSLREPSLGPVFGMKGGAAGGGYAQVVPMDELNLHFTGDLHAIGAANNLLAAMVDNHVYWQSAPQIDTRRVLWKRCVDMNDRALREVTVGLGGLTNGYARTDGFDITVASEVMAIFCLATDMSDLQRRLGNIIVGYTRKREPVTARDLKADGAMAALLVEALQPNIVQTLENNPAVIHGGPFANIAHGCSSVISTKLSLKLADWVITEGGFGADLGAEKFLNIKCRKAGLRPAAAVVVATVRALKLHGGEDAKSLSAGENLGAVEAGMPNLLRHCENVKKFGLPALVAINTFPTDTPAELALVKKLCEDQGLVAVQSDHFLDGGKGSTDIAQALIDLTESEESSYAPLYPDDAPLEEKLRTIAREVYRAEDINLSKTAATKLKQFTRLGYGHLPVCVAKTQYSFTNDEKAVNAPSGHTIDIADCRLSAGAEFVVVLTGSVMTMPGLPKKPAAEAVGVEEDGSIYGLF